MLIAYSTGFNGQIKELLLDNELKDQDNNILIQIVSYNHNLDNLRNDKVI